MLVAGGRFSNLKVVSVIICVQPFVKLCISFMRVHALMFLVTNMGSVFIPV